MIAELISVKKEDLNKKINYKLLIIKKSMYEIESNFRLPFLLSNIASRHFSQIY